MAPCLYRSAVSLSNAFFRLGSVSLSAIAISCGGQMNDEFDASTGGQAGDAGASAAGHPGGGVPGRAGDGGGSGAGFGSSGKSGSSGWGGASGSSAVAGAAGYEDPGCPPQEPLPHQNECELFSSWSGCPTGLSCYPFVQYPTEPCGQELYGTVCAPAGSGRQGDPCDGEPCADRHVCVITGQGNQCVQMCPLTGDDGCPPGLVCASVDVEGVGACF